ncbi:MAG: ATP-binding cassette domain-containing protein [Candidatus Manganitrophus sp.]|nr:MAG: ATP-binding cassette domain-containing protein [Candidatus Manganitrophus sp.]
MSIEIRRVTKQFGDFAALKEIDLTINTGELVALLGPSGSGKTTLLRIMAGLETPDSGEILFHGENATDRSVRDRHVGFVFQHYALFKHMTVFENVAFGLRVRPRNHRPSNEEIRAKVHSLLQLVQLDRMESNAILLSSPADSGSAWRSPARWRSSRRCCCSTSRSARSTPRSARSSVAGCVGCTMNSTSPASSSHTTRRRRWKWPTGSS